MCIVLRNVEEYVGIKLGDGDCGGVRAGGDGRGNGGVRTRGLLRDGEGGRGWDGSAWL